MQPHLGQGRHKRGATLLDQLSPVIKAIGTADFSSTLLASVNRVVPTDHCSAFRMPPGSSQLVRLFSASRYDMAFAERASTSYAERFWRLDSAIPLQSAKQPLIAAVSRQTWDSIADHQFRTECYIDPGVVDRVSILSRDVENGTLIVSFFRRARTGFFRDQDVEVLSSLSIFVTTAVLRQAAFAIRSFAGAERLSSRELQVATALASGKTCVDVAAALQLSFASVETYRKRLYRKLDVCNRAELAGLMRA
jgi:DNA-binding CsgD family transcriptional regulator